MSLRSLMAEMLGKAAGCCKGKGGSMHMTDASIGLLGRQRHRRRAVADRGRRGAHRAGQKDRRDLGRPSSAKAPSNIGAFHESLNMAAIMKLPVLFSVREQRVWRIQRVEQDHAD